LLGVNDWNQQPPPQPGPGEQPWQAQQPDPQPGFPPNTPPGYPPGGQPGYPPGGQPGYPAGGQPGYPPGPQGYAGRPPELPGLNLWLTLSIVGVTVLGCGVAGLPFNIVALVFAILAWTARGRGGLDRARTHLKRAKIFGIIGLVLALANIAVGITAAITSGSST
jgi:hypothetical protein